MATTYYIGDLVQITAAFTNNAGAASDPTTVTFAYKDPSGTTTTLVYGTDAALVKSSTGNYYVNITITQSGTWSYKWSATGTSVYRAGQGDIYVQPSNV